jgi:NAD-dependent SIR2 family protein deacetylase
MLDTKKKCSVCDWANVYDSKDDWRHTGALEVCPKCGKPLLTVPYKPIT